MIRKTFLFMLIVFALICVGSMAAGADELNRGAEAQSSLDLGKSKLGFGFQAGLVAGRDFVSGQLIVGIKQGANINAINKAAMALRGKTVKEIESSAVLLEFPSEEAAVAAVQKLRARKDVTFIERNGFMSIPPTPQIPDRRRGSSTDQAIRPMTVSSDPGTGHQWHLTVIRKTATLPTLSTTPPTVAVLDTGVDYTHSDLAGRVILGFNAVANNTDPYDDNGHGTHVAGIIAARASNGIYGEGICPNCKILAVKVLDSYGSGTFFDIAKGMSYARTAVTTPETKVINMSLGGAASSLIASEVLAIKNAGKVLVASAGNSNTSSKTYAYPGADANTALRVMATNQNDARAYFSNFSPTTAASQFNIAAPGWKVFSTLPSEGFGTMSGTSMASPVVAGGAALVWGQLPTLTRDQLVSRLLTYAKTISKGFAASTKRLDVRKAITGTSETALIGRIIDPFIGSAPSPNTTPAVAKLYDGSTLLTYDKTDRGGSYEMTGLTAGTRNLYGAMTGYVTAPVRSGVAITSGLVAGPYTDALPRARSTGFATITLDWWTSQPIIETTGCTGTCNGWEFDLWVKLPSGAYIDPYYNWGDLLTSPYVVCPRDSASSLEPLETIVIGSSAANGQYKVFVDNYPWEDEWNRSWTGSLASVQVYNGSSAVSGASFASPPSSCGTYRYWVLGTLTKSGTSYTWATTNTCTDTKP